MLSPPTARARPPPLASRRLEPAPSAFASTSDLRRPSIRALANCLTIFPKTMNPNSAALMPIRSTSFPNLSAPESDDAKLRSLNSRLCNGNTLYGLFLFSSSPLLAEIAGLAGYDFVIVDLEHGYGGISDALPCLRASRN